jgi:ABC-type multidrug transport system fused ATPase/permease subunit
VQVLDSDAVVVIDAGQVIEQGPPQELLARSDSKFAALVHASRAYGSKANAAS